MRYIEFPEPIILENMDGSEQTEPMTMPRFLLDQILLDPELGKKMSTIEIVHEVRTRLKKVVKAELNMLPVENEEHKIILERVENPSIPFNPLHAHAWIILKEAIKSAPKEEPKPSEPEPEPDKGEPEKETEANEANPPN